jgi:pimeloyl-ACP methyl ester carboxylesterase
MPFAETEYGKIHFSASSADNRKNLVLIHGSGGNHLGWPACARDLPGVNVFALDLPGHGSSEGQGQRRVEDYVRCVAQFVQNLGLTRVTLCGHSLGGAIVLSLALEKPDWLEKIVGVGTGARLRVNPAILEGIETNFEGSISLMEQFLYGPDADKQAIAAGQSLFKSIDPKVVLNDFLACDRFDVMEKISRIDIPTLVVAGTHDQLTPQKYGEYLAKNIPGAQLVVLSGAGHMMPLEKAEEFCLALENFIKG